MKREPACPDPGPIFYGATARRSGGADLAEPNADCEHDTTANDNLDDGVSELAAHETIANESDRDEFTYHHRVSELQRDTEIWNQERNV